MGEPESFDSVVIGSGFGGSVVARELAAARRSVLVLERGQPFAPGSFPRTPDQMRRAFWRPDEGRHGLFELWDFESLSAIVASGLGGGSLIYANVMLRKDERTFAGTGESGSWPISRADLEPHYNAVQDIQQPQRYPVGRGAPYGNTQRSLAMFEAANRLRLPATFPPLAVRFAPRSGAAPAPGLQIDDGGGNLHGVPRSTCLLGGECNLGCNVGAKDTLDFTFLDLAYADGAEIRCCCEATLIERRGGSGGFRVLYRQHRLARAGHPPHLLDPDPAERREVHAREVILACGAVGTVRLLLRNRPGLPGLSPALGTRASGNGDYLGFVRGATRNGGPRYLQPSHGPVITASISVDEQVSPSGRSFLIQDAGAPAFSEWIWQASELPGDLARAARPWLRRLSDKLRGQRDTAASGFVAGLFGDAHASAAMMPLLAMGHDVPGGRYRLAADGRLELDWPGHDSRSYFDGVRATMRQVAKAMGGTLLVTPTDRLSRAVSVHMVGGAAMAADARRGVVDPWGRVHGHPGLWVVDGAVMPGPVGVNPSFTIAAFAHRSAQAMLGRLG